MCVYISINILSSPIFSHYIPALILVMPKLDDASALF